MTRLPRPALRLALAGIIAIVGPLGLYAAEPIAIGGRSLGAHVKGITKQVVGPATLRLTVAEPGGPLGGVVVASGDQAVQADPQGRLELQIVGGADMSISVLGSGGDVITGQIALPSPRTEGVQALLMVDGATKSFQAFVAGDEESEQRIVVAMLAELETAWQSAQAAPAAQAGKGGATLRRAGDGTNRLVGGSHAPVIRRSADTDDATSTFDAPIVTDRLGDYDFATIDDGQEPGKLVLFTELLAPTTVFEKQGWELLHELDLLNENGGVGDKALPFYLEAAYDNRLDADAALALGAELLRQGVEMDPAEQARIEDAAIAAGLMAQTGTTRSAGSAGSALGPINVNRPQAPVHVMAADSFEPDDVACDPADALVLDGPVQDRTLDPAGDFDYVCIALTCGKRVKIQALGDAANTSNDNFIELRDPNGLLVGADDDSLASTPNFSLDAMLITDIELTGTYQIKVRRFSATTLGAYHLSATTVSTGPCVPLDTEPNETQGAAVLHLANGTVVSHWLRPLGDEDWFKFTATGGCGSSATITRTSPVSTTLDPVAPRIEVFSPTNVQLVALTTTATITFPTSDPGDYFIHVLAPGTVVQPPADYSNATHTNTGQYSLAITQGAAGGCDTFEPDNTRADCNDLAFGTTVTGHSIHVNDEDWYCFDLNCNDTIAITVTPTTPPANTLRARIELWAPHDAATFTTTFVTSGQATVGGSPITVTRTANHAGHWYVRVSTSTTTPATSGTYSISATRTAVLSANCGNSEPDSSPDQCLPIATDGTELQTKNLFPARDEDWICLPTLNCGDTIVIETFPVPPANTDTDTYIELYRLPDTFNRVAFDDQGSAIGGFSKLTFLVPSNAAAGPHVARVRHFSTTSTTANPYNVNVIVTSDDCPEPDPFEPDDTIDDCNPLTPNGVPVTGHNVFPANNADFYCVSLTCGENLSVTVQPTSPSLRPSLQLTAPDGSVLQTFTAASAGLPATVSQSSLDAGTYGLRVTSSTVTPQTLGGYTITATATPGTCLVDPFEPDNTPATCRPVGLPMTESRAINPNTDSDYYCVLLDCGDGVSITVTPTTGTLRAIIRLDGPTGTNLGTATATAPGLPVTLTDAVFTSGDHTIEIDSSTSTTGGYDITITKFSALPCTDAYEPDNTRALCKPIPTDGSLQHRTLLPHPDEDHACFEVTECGTKLTVRTATPSPVFDDADTTIFVYDPDGVQVATATTGGGASHALLSIIVSDVGTYSVKVVPASTTATSTSWGQYDLSVKADDAKTALIVPPVEQTPLPAHTQLDAQALATTPFGDEPFIDIAPTGTPIVIGATASVLVPIGFSFEYYGNTYTDVFMNDNGYLSFTFGGTWAGVSNECLPAATSPDNYISGYHGEDLACCTADPFFIQTSGTPGNRIFIAQWNERTVVGCTGCMLTFEIILHEATGDVDIRFREMIGTLADGESATVGVENMGGTAGVLFSCNELVDFSNGSLHFVAADNYAIDVSGAGLTDYPSAAPCFPPPPPYAVTEDTAPFIDISLTGNNLGPVADDSFTTIVLPIVFPYFDVGETQVNIGSNGFLNFGTGSPLQTNTCTFPGTAVPNGTLAAFWDDLDPAVHGAIYWQLFGVPGSGSAFVVFQWDELPFWQVDGVWNGTMNTFEAILYESGVIEYRYDVMDPTPRGTGNSATVGIENQAGTVGIEYGCNVANTVGDGVRLTFTPQDPEPLPERFSWFDAATNELLAVGPTYLHPIEGTCELRLHVEVYSPGSCCLMTEDQLVSVEDRGGPVIDQQPVISGTGCAFLWPPQHGYVEFSVADLGVTAHDVCGNGVSIGFSTATSSSQPEDSPDLGDGGTRGDIKISPDKQRIALRAERNGACGPLDRTYSVIVEASDSLGNVSLSNPVSVCVYHDQGHAPPGPYMSALPNSGPNDSRPGWLNGTYGTGCGAGCSMTCDPTQSRP